MPKYIVYHDAPLRERRYLARIENKRPHFTTARRMAKEYETRNAAETAAKQAFMYSGYPWMVQEVEDGRRCD